MKRSDIQGQPVMKMRYSERLRFALKDLWKRRLMTFFNGAAVFIAVVYFLLPAFYGLSIYRYQQSVLDESLPTLVVASCPDVTDDQLRFTNERIGQLGGMAETKLVFPKVELGIKFALDSRSSVDLPLEATVPGDPGLSASRLTWGRPVRGTEGCEAVIPKALFEKMGGVVREDGPTPAAALVQVSRTVAGQTQTQKISVAICGIIGHQSIDKIYAPLDFVRQLDRWCSNKTNNLDGTPDFPRIDYSHGFAYVPVEEHRRIEAEAKRLNVLLHLEGEVAGYDAPPEIWLAAERDGAGSELPEIAKAIEAFGAEVYPVRTLSWRSAGVECVVEALTPADPRWRTVAAGRPLQLGEAFVRADAGRRIRDPLGDVQIVGEIDAPGAGDVYCLPETLQWLAFDHRACPLVSRITWMETGDFELAARWEQESPGSVAPDWRFYWAIYGLRQNQNEVRLGNLRKEQVGSPTTDLPGTGEEDVQVERPEIVGPVHSVDDLLSQLHAKAPDVSCDVVYDGAIQLTKSPSVTAVVPCRFIPDQLFNKLASDKPKDALSNGKIVRCFQIGPNVETGVRAAGCSLEIVGSLAGTTTTLLFPASVRSAICPAAERRGLACWADWRRAGEMNAFFARQGESVTLFYALGPTLFSRTRAGDLESCRTWLDKDSRLCKLLELNALAVAGSSGRQRIDTVCTTPTHSKTIHGNLCFLQDPASGWQESIVESGGYRHQLRLWHSNRLPNGMAILDESVFRRLAFDAARGKCELPEVGSSAAAVRVAPIHYSKTRRVVESKGWRLIPLTHVREQPLLKFRVVDAQRSDGRVGEDLLRILAMTKPTFAAAVPALPMEAELNGRVVLEASNPEDPHRFAVELISGGWLSGDSHNEIVLPTSAAERLMPGRPLRDSLGTVVEVQFHRHSRISASEPALRLPLKVVGLVKSEAAVAPLELLRQVALWSEGKVVFNDSKMTFETPGAIYTRRGHVRCNIHAADLASVEPLVGKLRRMGYRTEDSLADQQGLRRLGQALGFVVGTFAFGCLLIAGKMIVVTTMMNVTSKRYEIGILKAHGMGTGSILSIFAIQGAVIGAGAFLIGGVFVAALEPMLRSWIGTSFQIPMETIVTGSLWSVESAWLLAIAFVAALLLSTLGMVLPAAGAAARLPVEILQRRE